MNKKIVIASDHGGFVYKKEIIDHLKKIGYEPIDAGTYTQESTDYPIFALKAAEMVSKKEADYGILLCNSGIGISIAANKVKGVRAALAYSDEVARLSREHNDANMIAFGAHMMSLKDVLHRIDIFLATPTSSETRHIRRVNEIKDYEK